MKGNVFPRSRAPRGDRARRYLLDLDGTLPLPGFGVLLNVRLGPTLGLVLDCLI